MLLYENKGNYREEISKKFEELKSELFDDPRHPPFEDGCRFQQKHSLGGLLNRPRPGHSGAAMTL